MNREMDLRETAFRRLLWRTAVTPVLLMLAASFFLAKLVARLLDDARWVDHTDQVIGEATRCKETGLGMLRNLRGFQISGAADYESAYLSQSREIAGQFQTLQNLVSDNPPQGRRLEEIKSEFQQWLILAEQTFGKLQRKETVEPAVLESGKLAFDNFLSRLDEFVRIEEGLREKRNNALTRLDRNIRAWRTVILVGVGALLSLVLGYELNSMARIYRGAETFARERAELLQTTLASIGDAVIATDSNGRITFMNGVAEQLTGASLSEAKDKPLREVFDIISEKTGQPIPDPVSKVLKTGVTVGLANHSLLRSRNGKKIPIADSGAPIRDRQGQTRGVVLVFRDATGEQQAQRTQGYLAAIVKCSDDPIISKDLNGIITAWNGGAERLFGYTESEAIGRPITLIVPPERQDEEPAILETIRRGAGVDHMDTVRMTRDGRRLPVLVTISPILDEDGVVIGASKIVRDISKLKADEEALRRARDELEQRVTERTRELTAANEKLMQADRYKSEFLAAMSHELRTPLNSIIGFSEIIKSGRAGPVTDKQAEYLGMAHGSAKHLLTLINDLLDLSRIEAGKDELFVESFEVEPVIQEAVASVRHAAQNKGVHLESNCRGAGEIRSDRKKVYQVILNLLNNAVKFTNRGKVTIEAQKQNGELQVSVADTGIGMTREQLDSLFQAFRRGEQPARRIYEGTGLGLYLCKKLVTLLGGEIRAESRLGEGSRFSFKIPMEKESHG